MKIRIHDQTTIADVQRQFSERFPYLKLEFFSKRHKTGEGTQMRFLLPRNKCLNDIRKTQRDGDLEIYADMRVSDLEQLFSVHFDLGVQVFRKSGQSWLETILTDSWTLREQNTEGEFLSTRTKPDLPDYDDDVD